MQVEVFAAERRARLTVADAALLPAVRAGLERLGEDGWEDGIVAAAAQIWLENYAAEAPDAGYQRAMDRFRARLRETLAKTTDGQNPNTQANRITKWLSTYAVNDGTTQGSYRRGVRFKLWVDMEDSAVRASHRETAGQVVPIGSTFTVAGHKMAYPGEPVGPIELWIECRCVAMPASRTGETMTANTFDLGDSQPVDEPMENEPRQGALIVLLPATDDPITAATSEDQAHMTTIWFGDVNEMPTDREELEQAVRLYSQDLDGPVVVPVRERGTLGDEGADVVFLEPTDSLIALRDGMLANEPIRQAHAAAEQFPEWTPHVTLGYPEGVENGPAVGEYDGTEVTFDRLGLWLGGDYTEYPMGGTVSTITADAKVVVTREGEDATTQHGPFDSQAAATAWIESQAAAGVNASFDMAEIIADEPGIPAEDYVQDDELDDDEEPITEVPVHGVLAPEGVATGDGRGFRVGALGSRPITPTRGLPLRLEIVGSHGGNQTSEVVTVGRIDEIFRDEATNTMRFRGAIILSKAHAQEAIEGIIDGSGTGVSIDADAMAVDNESFSDEAMAEAEAAGRMPTTWFSSALIAGLTIVPIGAFYEAYFALGHEFEDEMSDEDRAAAQAALTACGCAQVEQDGVVDLSDDTDANERAQAERDEFLRRVSEGEVVLASGGILEGTDQVLVGDKNGIDYIIPRSVLEKIYAPGTKDGPGWITHPIPTSRIRRYWVRGEGAAKIRWGVPGDFNRCRRQLAKYVQNPDWLAGLCANMHREALGVWPGQERGAHRAELIASGGIPAPMMSIVASASVQEAWPAEWFADPKFSTVTGMHIDKATGRIWGHLAQWNTCHIGIAGTCQKPPKSLSRYANFLKGVVDTTAGEQAVGTLTYGIGHADPRMRAAAATAHYDQMDAVFAYVNAGADKHGIWYAGVLKPGVDMELIDEIRAIGALSGDWRHIGRFGLDLVAAVAVNTPAYPASIAADAGIQTTAIGLGIVGPEGSEIVEADDEDVRANHEYIADVVVLALQKIDHKKREDALRQRALSLRQADLRRRILEKG